MGVDGVQPSMKTFKIKKHLAKKQKQNRPIPQWIRLRTDNTIRYVPQCVCVCVGPCPSLGERLPICQGQWRHAAHSSSRCVSSMWWWALLCSPTRRQADRGETCRGKTCMNVVHKETRG